MDPKEDRLVEAGWDRSTMANVTRLLGQGLFVGEYFNGEEKLDIIARVQPWHTPEELAAIPLHTPKRVFYQLVNWLISNAQQVPI